MEKCFCAGIAKISKFPEQVTARYATSQDLDEIMELSCLSIVRDFKYSIDNILSDAFTSYYTRQ